MNREFITTFSVILVLTIFFIGPIFVNAAARLQMPPNYLRISSGLIAHWTLDGQDTNWGANTTSDMSGQANTGTILNMSTTTSPVSGKLGQGFEFDGVNDCVDGGSQAVLDSVPTGSFSFWVYATTYAPTSARGLVGKDASGTNTGDIQFTILAANHASFPNKLFLTTQTASQADDSVVSDSALTLNSWNHVVGIFGGSGKSMYVNGVKQASTTANTQGMANASASFSIGALRVACTTFANVRMDDVRVYNRALSGAEVLNLYTSGAAKTVSSKTTKINVTSSANSALTSGLVGHWTFDGKNVPWTSATAATAIDSSGQGNTGTLANMVQATSPTPGKIGQALLFDGVDDFVNIVDADDTKYTGALTICAWAKIQTGSQYRHFAGKHAGGGGTDNPFDFRTTNAATPVLTLVHASAGGSRTWEGSSVTLNSWKHYCVAASTADINTAPTFYIDGAATTGTNTSGTGTGNATGSGANIRIGLRADSVVLMDGPIDDVRIYSRALSASEVLQLYNSTR